MTLGVITLGGGVLVRVAKGELMVYGQSNGYFIGKRNYLSVLVFLIGKERPKDKFPLSEG